MSSPNKPNIVLVVMDTARAENFSCYGYDRGTSPFLDSLAEENVKYENAFSQANWTLPSHASMFSGQYVSEHQVVEKSSFEGLDLLMSELDDSYHKMSVTNVPFLSESFDFDVFFDDFYYNEEEDFWRDVDAPSSIFESESTKETVFKSLKYFLKERRVDKLLEGVKRFSSKWLMLKDSGARKTNEKVEEMLEAHDEDKQFFMFLNYFEPHAPYRPPFPYSHFFLDKKIRWKSIIDSVDDNLRKYLGTDLEPNQRVIELKKAAYDSEIRYLDSKLEQLYSNIKEEYPNTVFIFTADHGQYFYEKERVNHVLGLNDEVTHVPMIEVFPESVQENIEGCIELRQLKNHILSISKGGALEPIESKDVAVSEDRGMDQSDIETVERLSSEKLSEGVIEQFSRYRASITDGDERLISFEDGDEKTFPSNINKQNSKILREKLESLLGRASTLTKKDQVEVEEDEVKDRLKDLGYL